MIIVQNVASALTFIYLFCPSRDTVKFTSVSVLWKHQQKQRDVAGSLRLLGEGSQLRSIQGPIAGEASSPLATGKQEGIEEMETSHQPGLIGITFLASGMLPGSDSTPKS